jgi:signal transduction histidine kinase
MVDADEAVLTVMLHNLVDNAVTFTREGGRVTLSAAAGAAGMVVAVEDNGHGVPPEDLARIQEPFEHAGRNEAAEHSRGAGLGLTLVRAFAELHGGKLELSSSPGLGFRAALVLPPAAMPATC